VWSSVSLVWAVVASGLCSLTPEDYARAGR
jgi:hypothetical protein